MRRLILLAATALIAGTSSMVAAPGPQLPLTQAARLAQEHLKERGLDNRVFISALMLESTAVARGRQYWYARWSQEVKADEKTEVGLRINMDGSLVRVLESKTKKYKDHRARTSRPSVLDLKH